MDTGSVNGEAGYSFERKQSRLDYFFDSSNSPILNSRITHWVETYIMAPIDNFISKCMEKPLGRIPHYNERRDKLLKGCLDKVLNGEKLGVVEQFRVGLQSRSVKPTYAVIYGVCGYMRYLKDDPLVGGMLISGSLLAVLHNRAMGGKLEKVTLIPDENKKELSGLLSKGDFNKVRTFLDECLYW